MLVEGRVEGLDAFKAIAPGDGPGDALRAWAEVSVTVTSGLAEQVTENAGETVWSQTTVRSSGSVRFDSSGLAAEVASERISGQARFNPGANPVRFSAPGSGFSMRLPVLADPQP